MKSKHPSKFLILAIVLCLVLWFGLRAVIVLLQQPNPNILLSKDGTNSSHIPFGVDRQQSQSQTNADRITMTMTEQLQQEKFDDERIQQQHQQSLFGQSTVVTTDRHDLTPQQQQQQERNCTQRLDVLEQFYQAKRTMRKSRTSAPPHVVKTVEKNRFDLYEQEAMCIMEERFGLGGPNFNEGQYQRFNSFGDGPKFVCAIDLLRQKNRDCLVYSVGSANRFDFENSVKKFLGCEIHTFDPTVTGPIRDGGSTVFHPWGVGKDGDIVSIAKKNATFTTWSIKHIMAELGHVGRTLDILKIDCEGCEWTALPDLFHAIRDGAIVVDQVLVEVHGPPLFPVIRAFFDAADEAEMRVFHKEPNHWGCYGYKCLEYALASKKYLQQANAMVLC